MKLAQLSKSMPPDLKALLHGNFRASLVLDLLLP